MAELLRADDPIFNGEDLIELYRNSILVSRAAQSASSQEADAMVTMLAQYKAARYGAVALTGTIYESLGNSLLAYGDAKEAAELANNAHSEAWNWMDAQMRILHRRRMVIRGINLAGRSPEDTDFTVLQGYMLGSLKGLFSYQKGELAIRCDPDESIKYDDGIRTVQLLDEANEPRVNVELLDWEPEPMRLPTAHRPGGGSLGSM